MEVLSFSTKPTGQQMLSFLTLLNILIHGVYEKFDENC